MLPLCFVLMPFGTKLDAAGHSIDFDAIYQDLISPAIGDAGLEALRADEEMTGGFIHKPMFERLILCEFAVADLTTANANVFYELGLRHAVRAYSTVCIFAEGRGQLPFDVAPLRALSYRTDAAGCLSELSVARKALSARLIAAREATPDSPVYQLVEGFPDIQHLKTDVFRDRLNYAESTKRRLRSIREKFKVEAAIPGQKAASTLQALDELKQLEVDLGDLSLAEAGVAVDLMLTARAVEAWDYMVDLPNRMAKPLARSVLVREQLGLALNRAGLRSEAARVLEELIRDRGVSSETCALLGRVFKDRWDDARMSGDALLARGLLDKSIEAYLQGFEADSRDYYPGINALTLMAQKETADPRATKLLPVVQYALTRRLAGRKPDYWDQATRLELAVLAKDRCEAENALADALATDPEPWQGVTTARNLGLLRDSAERQGHMIPWCLVLEKALAPPS